MKTVSGFRERLKKSGQFSTWGSLHCWHFFPLFPKNYNQNIHSLHSCQYLYSAQLILSKWIHEILFRMTYDSWWPKMTLEWPLDNKWFLVTDWVRRVIFRRFYFGKMPIGFPVPRIPKYPSLMLTQENWLSNSGLTNSGNPWSGVLANVPGASPFTSSMTPAHNPNNPFL